MEFASTAEAEAVYRQNCPPELAQRRVLAELLQLRTAGTIISNQGHGWTRWYLQAPDLADEAETDHERLQVLATHSSRVPASARIGGGGVTWLIM